MTWTWATGTTPDDPDLAADLAAGWVSRTAAESWLRDTWEGLADCGVVEVTLMEDSTAVYTMGLDSGD